MHAEVGTRGLGERHTGREEPYEDRPTRQDRPGCPGQDGCSFIESSPHNPKRWRSPSIWQPVPGLITPLGQKFFPNAQPESPNPQFGATSSLLYFVSSTSSTVKICLFTPSCLVHRSPSPALELEEPRSLHLPPPHHPSPPSSLLWLPSARTGSSSSGTTSRPTLPWKLQSRGNLVLAEKMERH